MILCEQEIGTSKEGGLQLDLSNAQLRIVRDRKPILELQRVLSSFAEQSGQPGALSDLRYFLDKPGLLRRCPVLLLLTRRDAPVIQQLTADDLLGVLLVYQYRAFGLKTGVYTSNDRSGLSTLVARRHNRDEVAHMLSSALLEHDGQLVLFSYRGEAPPADKHNPATLMTSTPSERVFRAARQRVVPDYLELAATFEGTLASIGQRTRSNMRYYRRRAEKELGCTFVPDAQISAAELQSLNRACMYAVSDKVARWRVATLATLDDPILAGIRDGEGRWMSLLGGRRQGSHTEVLWQMNRSDLPDYSLSLVLRSYLIEDEVRRGATRFLIEGGTPHPISKSFQNASLTDVVAMRRTFRARCILHVAHRWRGVSNELITLLKEPALRTR